MMLSQIAATAKPFPARTYIISLALWLSLCLGAMGIVVERNIHDVDRDLRLYGAAYSDHLDKEMIGNDTVLRGFSALFGSVGGTDPTTASRYARQVTKANPQIFSLEIVQAVEKGRLAEFVAQKRRAGIPNFSVKSFSYDADRKWQAPKDKPIYYPIVFREPMSAGAEDVLGLDADSVPFLRQAMTESLRRRTPVASHPFRLVQGNLGYVVFCPIQTFRRDGSPVEPGMRDERVVAMVIDAAELAEPVKFPAFDGGTLRIFHKDFQSDDPKGQLLALSGKTRGPIEYALFPSFVYERPLATMGEPLSLMVRRQVGWSDLSLGLLAFMALLTLMSSLLLVEYLRVSQQGRTERIENEKRLWQLANHDALTGLPNRMLLMDRLEQLLARMRRQGKCLAILFLDLDDFKEVNDTHGHEAGDQLLKLVAERLRAGVRVDDTVARLSGDEFIMLIESVENRSTLETVRQKIRQLMLDGFPINGQLLRVRASIGMAVFPDDGDSPEALIKQADKRMYEDKR